MFQPTVYCSAWLLGIAWNKAKKARRQRPQSAPEAPSTREDGSTPATPEQLCGQWEQHRLVARALERLPSAQRTLVELTYYLPLLRP